MTGLGKRYAQALMDTAGPGSAAQVLAELEALETSFRATPALRTLFENPGISWAEKEALLQALEREAGLMPVVGRFLRLLVKGRRLANFPEMVEAFRELRDAEQGLCRARLISARPLAPQSVGDFQQKLSKALGCPVVLDTAVSPGLLGGFKVQVGSTIYDGSVSGALKSLYRSMVKG